MRSRSDVLSFSCIHTPSGAHFRAGNYPDYTMMIVGSNMGVVGMTKEHYQLTLALKIPVFMVVTKVRCLQHSHIHTRISTHLVAT